MGYFPSRLYTEHDNIGRKYTKEDVDNLILNNISFEDIHNNINHYIENQIVNYNILSKDLLEANPQNVTF